MWILASFYPPFFVWINQLRCSGSSSMDRCSLDSEMDLKFSLWPLWLLPGQGSWYWVGLNWTGLSAVCISFVYNVSRGSYDDW